jgi:hypothetical protein
MLAARGLRPRFPRRLRALASLAANERRARTRSMRREPRDVGPGAPPPIPPPFASARFARCKRETCSRAVDETRAERCWPGGSAPDSPAVCERSLRSLQTTEPRLRGASLAQPTARSWALRARPRGPPGLNDSRFAHCVGGARRLGTPTRSRSPTRPSSRCMRGFWGPGGPPKGAGVRKHAPPSYLAR